MILVDCLLLTNASRLDLWRPQKLESENTSSIFIEVCLPSSTNQKATSWRLQKPIWTHPPKSLFFGLTLGFLEVSPTSSCSEIVVSSNNSTRPKFALSSLAEAIQVHRFKGKFDATASSKIAVPLMEKAISTASLG